MTDAELFEIDPRSRALADAPEMIMRWCANERRKFMEAASQEEAAGFDCAWHITESLNRTINQLVQVLIAHRKTECAASRLDSHASIIDLAASRLDSHASIIDLAASRLDSHASIIDLAMRALSLAKESHESLLKRQRPKDHDLDNEVWNRYYGLEGKRKHTAGQIAIDLDTTEAAVRMRIKRLKQAGRTPPTNKVRRT